MSWIERVRRERDERVQDESLKLGIPTWGEDDVYDLVAEFGVIARVELEAFMRDARRRARKNSTGESDSDISFLAKAVRAVYIRNPETRKLVKIEKDGRALRFERALGELLGVGDDDNKDSRALLLYLVKNNGVALGTLAGKVARWMSDTSASVEGEVLGE